MAEPVISVERDGRRAVVHLHGDVVVPTAGEVYRQLRAIATRRDVATVVVDFSGARRLDSAGIAAVSLVRRQLARSGKRLELEGLSGEHEAALDLVPALPTARVELPPEPGLVETIGDAVISAAANAKALGGLVAETARQAVAVATRRKRLPVGAFVTQVALMGANGVFIVGLLAFLLGMTIAFQGAILLRQFGAGVFVADSVGLAMVRELGPLVTAIILTGRTGAAIAAELGTMRVRSEIDALTTMGINPARFLVLPRLLSITLVGPALTLMAIFLGIAGGALVARLTIDMPLTAFWARIVERVDFGDFVHGIGKSFLFAWIIGLAGCHLGLRAGSDAGSVGAATTRTVVASVFFIIVTDAVVASVSTWLDHGATP
jgi:phospholipid/cholesterol/gamma-HCH transport system permease protein